jgi:hypothetical protein
MRRIWRRLAAVLAAIFLVGLAAAPGARADVDSGYFEHHCYPSNIDIHMWDRVVWHASTGDRTVWYGNQVWDDAGAGPGYVNSLGIWVRSLPNGTWVRKWYTEDPHLLNPDLFTGVDITVAGSGQVHAFKTRTYASGFMCEATVINN